MLIRHIDENIVIMKKFPVASSLPDDFVEPLVHLCTRHSGCRVAPALHDREQDSSKVSRLVLQVQGSLHDGQ
jgi:hypothetical protein